MLRGGSSLANNLTYGLSDSVGKFTGTLGKGLAELSMERDNRGLEGLCTTCASPPSRPSCVGPRLSRPEGVVGAGAEIARDRP